MQGVKVFEIFVEYRRRMRTRSVIAHLSSHSVAIIDELLPIQSLCFVL